MYDYGARFYMSDIGRWGVIDPRSQYTHEAYSYVWNNPIFFNDPTGMTGEPCENCPKPEKTRTQNIQEVVITVYRPIPVKPVGLDFSSAGTILSGVAVMRAPNPYLLLASLAATVITYNMPKINMPISAYKIENITYNPDESAGTFLDKLGNIDDTTDINGVTVPIDDSGIEKPIDFLAFSKVARGNQRDTGLIGHSDEDIATELASLKGNLSKEQKAQKQRLVKEQKARTTRNTQKKSGEKGTGTGRR